MDSAHIKYEGHNHEIIIKIFMCIICNDYATYEKYEETKNECYGIFYVIG